MNTSLPTGRLVAASIVSAAMSLTGCALKPYVRTDGLQTTLPVPSSLSQTSPYAGDIAQAIVDVDAQRRAYLDALDARTTARNIVNGGLLVLTAATIYKGIVHTSEATKDVLAQSGAIGATAYGLGVYGNSPPTEHAYLRAHLGLTCLVVRARPWLMQLSEYQDLYGPSPGVATTAKTVALQKRIDELDKAHELAIVASDDQSKTSLSKQTKSISYALYLARKTYRSAQHLKGYIDNAGFQLRQEANVVVSQANRAILKEQPGITKPGDGQLGQMANLSAVFQNVKPVDVPPSDDKEDSRTGDQGVNNNPTAETSKPPTADASTEQSTATSEAGQAADAMEARVAKLESTLMTQKPIRAVALSKALLSVSTLTDLAARKADLYAAMRPVTAVLTRVYALKPYIRAVPECRGGEGEALRLTPDADEVMLAPGAIHEITVTGGVGYPRLTLAGTVSGAFLTTSLNDGVAKARIVIPSMMKAGEFSLLVRDGGGTQSDEVRFVVKGGGK